MDIYSDCNPQKTAKYDQIPTSYPKPRSNKTQLRGYNSSSRQGLSNLTLLTAPTTPLDSPSKIFGHAFRPLSNTNMKFRHHNFHRYSCLSVYLPQLCRFFLTCYIPWLSVVFRSPSKSYERKKLPSAIDIK